jgi:hypothetical protein
MCALNLLDITSKFWVVAMFVIVTLNTVVCEKYVGMLMIYLCTELHGRHVILHFQINTLTKAAYFLNYL